MGDGTVLARIGLDAHGGIIISLLYERKSYKFKNELSYLHDKAKSDHLTFVAGARPELLWRLAGPNVVAITALTAVSVCRCLVCWAIGDCGAGEFSLVFPFQTLMQMMAGGSIGGGVTSSMARALGKGR